MYSILSAWKGNINKDKDEGHCDDDDYNPWAIFRTSAAVQVHFNFGWRWIPIAGAEEGQSGGSAMFTASK